MWWGYTPAIDFQEHLIETKGQNITELNILIVWGSDGRHILQTLARRYRNPKRKLNFYVIEPLVDFIAKQMMLFTVALEPPNILGLQEKARLWMEIYGNLLVRPSTANYIVQKSRQLVLMVTDESYLDFRLPLVKINQMKFKEIDTLENTFHFWENNSNFNCVFMWDIRLRRSLGVRYDNRDGAFDWDYQMHLRNVPGGDRVNYQEYKHWRETGVAFTWVETEGVEPNLTFATGITAKGSKLVSQGYLGDIVNGPFISFGVETEDVDMLRTSNGVHVKRSADIMERNMFHLFYEIQEGKTFKHEGGGDEDDLGTVIRDIGKVDFSKSMEATSPRGNQNDNLKKKERYSAIYIPKAQVHFLPCNSIKKMPQSSKYVNFFNMVYLSNTAVKTFGTSLKQMIQNDARIIIESKKYIVGIPKQEMETFVDNVNDLAKDNNWVQTQPFDPYKDNVALFKKQE